MDLPLCIFLKVLVLNMNINKYISGVLNIKKIIRHIFQKQNDLTFFDAEELRLDFKSRYHNFKLLLTANNKALEVMADIERTLFCDNAFGMSFIRSSCTAASVNVFTMIKSLKKLAPEKYLGLEDKFNEIMLHIDSILNQKRKIRDTRLVIPLDDVNKDMAGIVGSKMANIGEIKNELDINTPKGFAITTAAYETFVSENDLQTEIDRLFQAEGGDNLQEFNILSSRLQQYVINADIPDSLADAINQAWKKLEYQSETGKQTMVALRSSAIGEDLEGSSFAGQYQSILNVNVDNIFHSYKEVLASKYSVQAILYRLKRGFKDEDISMCVGCVEMIDAKAGGVIYSKNPVDMDDDSVFINSVWGLPKSVVDGSDSNDQFVVSRKPAVELVFENVRTKKIKLTCFPKSGLQREILPEDLQNAPSITKERVLKLAKIAITLEEYYSTSQDIEWAIAKDGLIYILQCRPMQQVKRNFKNSRPTPVKANNRSIIIKGGITASPGSACGKVFLAEKRADILAFPQDAVLVVRQALPVWAALLSRASAVISEQGGFAGHLANVAREFSVPAIFGVENAMTILKDENKITVDADSLAIHKGKIESLLINKPVKKNLMRKSPVYETLEKVSSFIVPLNLLDSSSNGFKPTNCKTLHDITRFIHEQSVREMFNFGKEHKFSERASKQLYYHAPMNWWILNLDDGFRKEIISRYVRLENIESVPMLAFWEGFAAIPWEGPPPIDGKGLMSVMFQSTVNPELTPVVKSKYTDRNYFMISKNYCNLSSRLGYHFNTMEALVSDRAIENYVSFQFKGGAADHNRRIKRVRFIATILEEYDFRVDVKKDNLVARIEGYDKKYMKKRLKILGYMLLHTRQLDMIMANNKMVEYYRLKIQKDTAKIIK